MEINLQPVFKYLDEMKGELKADIKAVDNKVDTLQLSVDGLVKQVKDFGEEHVILKRRVEVLEQTVS